MVEGAVETIPKIKPRKMKELHLIEKMQVSQRLPGSLKTVKIKVKAMSQVWVRVRAMARISIVTVSIYIIRINHITLTPTLTSTHS